MVSEANPSNGWPSSNYVDLSDLNKADFILLRDKLIKEIIIGKKNIPINNSQDIKKAVGIIWFHTKP